MKEWWWEEEEEEEVGDCTVWEEGGRLCCCTLPPQVAFKLQNEVINFLRGLIHITLFCYTLETHQSTFKILTGTNMPLDFSAPTRWTTAPE